MRSSPRRSLLTSRRSLPLLLAGALCAGCGLGVSNPEDLGDTPSGEVEVTEGALLPWAQGNQWTYRVTESGTVTQKVTGVGALETVGGSGPYQDTRAHRVTTSKSTGGTTVSWQALSGTRLVRYREQSFDVGVESAQSEEWWSPAKLHVDMTAEHLVPGASWTESYQETKQKTGQAAESETTRDVWTVVADGQAVTVPAGTFSALVLRKSGTSKVKTYWFVRGVGKVKEVGEQTEELVSYQVAPTSSSN